MNISLRNSDGYVIIDIHSSVLDYDLANIMRATLRDLLASKNYNIVINMSLVCSIDSKVLAYLIAAQKKCKKNNGEIRIYGAQPDILMIFYVIQLDKYINIFNNEFDAINYKNLLVKRRFRII